MDREDIIKTISEILVFESDKIPKEAASEWQLTQDKLVGSGFSDTLKRYVKMELREDYFHTAGRYDEGWIKQKIHELAAATIANPSYLESEYDWLLTARAKKAYLFGHELGRLDSESSLLPNLLSAYQQSQNEKDVNFLGGYFRALFERKPSLWEEQLDLLSKNFFFKPLIPDLTSLSGMSDKAAQRIVAMVRNEDVDAPHLAALVRGDIRSLSEETITDATNLTLEKMHSNGAYLALLLLRHYYMIDDQGALPRDVTTRVLLDPYFWNNAGIESHKSRVDSDWVQIATRLSCENPDIDELLADTILLNFGKDGSIAGLYDSEAYRFLYATIKRKPSAMWSRIASYLGPPIDERAYNLKEWLKGEKGFKTSESSALELINPADIWAWIEKDVDKRAWYFASFVAPYIERDDERSFLARELLIRYGNRADVRRNFTANYSSGVFWGSLKEKFQKRKDHLLEIKKLEPNPNIITWIDEYVTALDNDIEREKIREERGDFSV